MWVEFSISACIPLPFTAVILQLRSSKDTGGVGGGSNPHQSKALVALPLSYNTRIKDGQTVVLY